MTMISGLSDVLRKVVDVSDRQVVPLREEMQFLQKYLDIQKVRFSDSPQAECRCSRGVSGIAGAEAHPCNRSSKTRSSTVSRSKPAAGGSASACSGRTVPLSFRVYNDGGKVSQRLGERPVRVGIANIRSRLQMLYGDDFEFRLEKSRRRRRSPYVRALQEG